MNTKEEITLYLSYVRGVCEKIERTCRSIKQEYLIRTVFKPVRTIWHMLTKVKGKVSDDKGVVYEIPCRNCKHVYTGETKRTLKRGIVEHKQAVKKFDVKTGVAVHANRHDYNVNWEEAKVGRPSVVSEIQSVTT